MNKNNKRIATALFSTMILAGALAPASATAAEVLGGGHNPPTEETDTRRPETGNLIIHKLQFNKDEKPNFNGKHDGTEFTTSDTKGLGGITFDIYKVEDWSRSTDKPAGDPYKSGITSSVEGEEGLLEFNDLPAGRYLVVENTDNLPHGVNYTSESFLVDVPMTTADGTEWLEDVHVYPKNRLILATVDFYKYFEKSKHQKDATATFELWKEMGEEDLFIETVETDDEGRVFFTAEQKGLETGHYYAMETQVTDPYGINEDLIHFEVTNDDHDEDLTDEEASIEMKIEYGIDGKFENYTLPNPVKDNKDDDDDDDSANLNELVQWDISTRIPSDIDDYELFRFTDILDSRLDYVGNVVLKVNDHILTGIVKEGSSEYPDTLGGGTLVLDLDSTQLETYAGQTLHITFDTKINKTALMGDLIPNNFTLDFNNGSGLDSRTMEKPPYAWTGGHKFDKVSNSKKLDNFAGAQFWVYKFVGDEKHYLQQDHTWSTATDAAMKYTSRENGTFEVTGLSMGTYYLEERVALPGHMLSPDIKFSVTRDSFNLKRPTEVMNKTQIRLPETGGMGTIAFTIAGIGMMAGAVKLYKKEEE